MSKSTVTAPKSTQRRRPTDPARYYCGVKLVVHVAPPTATSTSTVKPDMALPIRNGTVALPALSVLPVFVVAVVL
jgi:hypothetical protein